ncbi:hypothetical protein WJX77_000673 [Trebouxia sp. C0004]
MTVKASTSRNRFSVSKVAILLLIVTQRQCQTDSSTTHSKLCIRLKLEGQLEVHRSLQPRRQIACSAPHSQTRQCPQLSASLVFCWFESSFGTGAIANALQQRRSLDAGQSSSLTRSSLDACGSVASPGVPVHSSYASGASDEDDEVESHDHETAEVQDIFTELLEIFDASAPSSQQQHRATNNLWSFYAAHADELEACAPEFESMSSTRLVLAPEQTAFARVLTSSSDLVPQKLSSSKFNRTRFIYVINEAFMQKFLIEQQTIR